MSQRKQQRTWRSALRKIKFDSDEKSKVITHVQKFIDGSSKLKDKVSRIEMRGHWIYFYVLEEPFLQEGAVYTKPLIDGKYFEFPYARITLNDLALTDCSVDWQRYNDQWISLYSGPLDSCLVDLEDDEGWFA